MAETTPRRATHCGTIAAAIASTGFLMLAWIKPDLPPPPQGLEGYVITVVGFGFGFLGKVARKRGWV